MDVISTIFTIVTSFIFGRYEANKKAHPLSEGMISPGRINRIVSLIFLIFGILGLFILSILKILNKYPLSNWIMDIIVATLFVVLFVIVLCDKNQWANPLPHTIIDGIDYYILHDLGNGYVQVIDINYKKYKRFVVKPWSYFKNCEFNFKIFPR